MSKKTDDSIEKFFRKAVSQYDTRFRESDWQKMEQMLDAQSSLKNNGGSFRTIKRAAFGFAALIMVSGAVYFLTLNKENSSENKISESKNSPLREMQAAAEKKAPADEGNEKKSTAGLLSSEKPSEKTEALVQSNSAQSRSKNDNTSIEAKTQNTVRVESEHKQPPSSGEDQKLTTAQKAVKKNRTPDQHNASLKTGSVSPELSESATTQNSSKSVIQKPESGRTVIPGTETKDDHAQKIVKDKGALSQTDTRVETASVSSEITRNKTAQSDDESVLQKSEPGKTITLRTEKGDNNVAGTTAKVLKNNEGLAEHDTPVKTASVSSEITGNKAAQNDNESVIQKSGTGKTITVHPKPDNNNVAGTTAKVVKNNDWSGERDTPVKPGITGNTSVQNANESTSQKQKSGEALIVSAETDGNRDDAGDSKKSSVNAVVGTPVSDKDSVDKPDEKAEEAIVIKKEEDKEEKPELKTGSRWSVFVSLAPDFSSTGFGQLSAPGSAYGFQIGYQLFSKISLHTGLIRSSKKYKSDGADYHPPDGYWGYRTNGVVPDKIKGQCAVWEIPLWVQVDLRQRERSRLYVSAGASGYLMTSQSYDYSFKSENPGAAKGWSSSESDTYPLAVGHLSAGYERNITPSIGLGIEPFVKIPFEGMGWSKVNLFTTGFYVNVRYRFLKRVSPL